MSSQRQEWFRTEANGNTVWRLERKQNVLRERWTTSDGKHHKREHHCSTRAFALQLESRLIAWRESEGFTAKTLRVSSTDQRLPYLGLTLEQCTQLSLRLRAMCNFSHYELRSLIQQYVPERDESSRVLWHLVRHGFLPAGESLGVLELLAETATEVPSEELAKVLLQLPAEHKRLRREGEGYAYQHLLPKSYEPLLSLLFSYCSRNPTALRSIEKKLPPWLSVAVDFVRGCCNEKLPARRAQRMLRLLAQAEARGAGLSNWNYSRLSPEGTIENVRLTAPTFCKPLALHFGSEEQWNRALLFVAQRQPGWPLAPFFEMVRTCSIDALCALTRSCAQRAELFRVVLEQREDTPSQLFYATRRLYRYRNETDPAHEFFALLAVAKYRKAAKNLPKTLLSYLAFRCAPCTFDGSENLFLYQPGIEALRPEEAHRILQRSINDPSRIPSGLFVLAIHPNAALLDAFFARVPSLIGIYPSELGLLGVRALPYLRRAWETERSEYRDTLRLSLLHVLATAFREAPEQVSPWWEELLQLDAPTYFWQDSRSAVLFRRVVSAMPYDRRRHYLLQHIATDQHPDRAFGLLPLLENDEDFRTGVKSFLSRRKLVSPSDRYWPLSAHNQRLRAVLDELRADPSTDATLLSELADYEPS